MNPKNIRWSILAPGGIANKFAHDLKLINGITLRAVGSRSYERASSFAKQYGFEKAYGSYEELVKDPETDVIYIASPHTHHFEHTMLCLEHDKHVICEKPFAMSKKQAIQMIELARKRNLFLMEGLWTRFLPSFVKCKKMAEEGIIGDLKVILASFGFRVKYDEQHRAFNMKLGGGTVLDIGIYNLFLAYCIFGKPDKIQAIAQKSPTGSDLSCSVQLNYLSGKMVSLFSSFDVLATNTAEIIGEKGTLRLNKLWIVPTSITLVNEQGKEKLIKVSSRGNGFYYIANEVIRCLNEGLLESPLWSLQDTINLSEIMDEILSQLHISYPEV